MSRAPSTVQKVPDTRLPEDLDEILRKTSRSIYLTLKVVPRAIRRQLMLGYLFCRAADTIADTRALPKDHRIEMLGLYRHQFESDNPDSAAIKNISGLVENLGSDQQESGFSVVEATLLRRLDGCFEIYSLLEEADRDLFKRLLCTLTQGMQLDLETFPPEESALKEGALQALESSEDLDRYCYHVAGCVGEFWTDLQLGHMSALSSIDARVMRDRGVRFGKGLQMTNILRDMPRDLRMGRCYMPRSSLEACGLSPEDLQHAVTADSTKADSQMLRREVVQKVSPLIDDLLDLTLAHYRCGWEYTLSIPRSIPRLR